MLSPSIFDKINLHVEKNNRTVPQTSSPRNKRQLHGYQDLVEVDYQYTSTFPIHTNKKNATKNRKRNKISSNAELSPYERFGPDASSQPKRKGTGVYFFLL
jgi:hypothetical protein